MLSAEDSPAPTSVQQEKAQGSTASSLDCGGKWRVSFARFDRDTCSWRTAQCSLLGDSDESSVIWPRSGMTVDGYAFLLPTVERPTRGTGSGFSGIPTPRANDAENRGNFDETNPRSGLAGFAKIYPTVIARDCRTVKGARRMPGSIGSEPLVTQIAEEEGATGGRLNPEFVEWLMGWPIGSTASSPLEMDRYREFMRQHGGF